MGARIVLIVVSIRNILKPTRSLYVFRLKSYGSNSGIHNFGDLDLDLDRGLDLDLDIDHDLDLGLDQYCIFVTLSRHFLMGRQCQNIKLVREMCVIDGDFKFEERSSNHYRCNRLRCPLARMAGLQCFNIGHNGHGIKLYEKLTCRRTIYSYM